MVSTRVKIVRVSVCLAIALSGCKPEHEPEFPYGVDESAGEPSERLETPSPARRGAAGPQRLELRSPGDPVGPSEDSVAAIKAELDGSKGAEGGDVAGPDGTTDIAAEVDETLNPGDTPPDAATGPIPGDEEGSAVDKAAPVASRNFSRNCSS